MCPFADPDAPCLAVADDSEETVAEPSVSDETSPPKAEEAEEEEEDEVARVQSVDAWSSVEDGQPGEPGHPSVSVGLGADGQVGSPAGFALEPEFEITPKSTSHFLENAAFTGAVALEGEGRELEPTATLGWGQRWVRNGDGGRWVPTIGGLTEFEAPMLADFGTGDVLSETLTLAERVGPGSFYLNGRGSLVLGAEPDARRMLTGLCAGYQWNVVDDKLNLVLDYVHQQDEARGAPDNDHAELSVTWVTGEHLTLGPGISVGLNGATPDLGGGLLLVLE